MVRPHTYTLVYYQLLISFRDTAGQERYKVSNSLMSWCRFRVDGSFASSLWCVSSLLGRRNVYEDSEIQTTKAPMYYRNANCAVVVYDITQSASLEKARTWIRELQRQADPSIVIALCGNKLDLSARRQVSQEEAKKYADEEGLMWTVTSAKTGEGVTEIFTAIGTCLCGLR